MPREGSFCLHPSSSPSSPDAVQRNRDPLPIAACIPRCDTDKVVALMLRSHTVVLAAHSRGAWFGCMDEGVPCARGAGVEGWAMHQLP